jgi:hypothetical protein
MIDRIPLAPWVPPQDSESERARERNDRGNHACTEDQDLLHREREGGLNRHRFRRPRGRSGVGDAEPARSHPGGVDRGDRRGPPPVVGSLLLTSRQDAGAIIAQQRRSLVNTLQACDRLQFGSDQELREALPGISIVQVVHVCDEGALDEALRVAPHVHALLVDSGTTASPVKQLGGAGRTHDWALGHEIKFQGRLLFLSKPLAGELVGLKPIDDGIRSILFSTTLPQRPRIPRRSKMFHLCFPSRPLPMSLAVRGAAWSVFPAVDPGLAPSILVES